METGRILVVDDNTSVLEAVELILGRAGHTVETTTQIFGLPMIVGRFQPDLLLLDFDLPALTGDKLALSLQSLRMAKPCRIVFHSAEADSVLRRAVLETKAAGYIPKGLPKPEFLARVRSYLPP